MATCINLCERLGDRYRITYEKAATGRGRKGDPWLMQIPCRLGTIYPYGGDVLALEIDFHDFTAARLQRMGLQVIQDGAREKTLLFNVDRFDEVAAIVEPKKRRRLAPEQREASVRRLAAYRFRGPADREQKRAARPEDAPPVPTAP